MATRSCALLHPRFVFAGAFGLALNADDFLFLTMNLSGQTGNGRGGVRNGLLEARGLGDQLLERGVRFRDPLTQLLDLALGGEDAARLRLFTASHDVTAAEHVALDASQRELHGRRDTGCCLERFRDHRAAHHRLDRLRERSADADHGRQGHGSGWRSVEPG